MDIKFECRVCGQHIVIDEGGAGLTVQCPNCNGNCVVPTPKGRHVTESDPGLSADCYHILQGSSREGPYTLAQVAEMLTEKEITLETLYAQPGMTEWMPLLENRRLFEEYAPGWLTEQQAQCALPVDDGTSYSVDFEVGMHADLWAQAIVEVMADLGHTVTATVHPASESVAADVLEEIGGKASVQLIPEGRYSVSPVAQSQKGVPADYTQKAQLNKEIVQLQAAGVEISDDWITIEEPSFSGQFRRSPNSRFILAWREENSADPIGWVVENGGFVLIDGEKIILRGTMRRPNDGRVANNGNFILSDWEESVFYAYSPSGEMLSRKEFESAADLHGISDDGRWAVTEGYAKSEDPDEPDQENEEDGDIENAPDSLGALLQLQNGGELWLFDLEQRTLRVHFKTHLRNPSQFRFDSEQQILHVSYEKRVIHRYSFDGDFLDAETWEKSRADYANGYQLVFAAEARLGVIQDTGIEAYAEVIKLLRRALGKGVSEFTQAKIQRHLGEIYHRCNEKVTALKHFNEALRLNPKIGVMKLAARLRTEIQAGG